LTGLGLATVAGPASAATVSPSVAAAATGRPVTPATGLPAGVTPKTSVNAAPQVRSAPAGAHLNYYGGKVIPDVRVYQVLYGAGTYTPEVSDTSTTDGASIASFYTGVTNSTYFDWLSEYNTTSPAQAIGRGSYAGQIMITPAASRNGSTVDDTQITAELQAQIAAGHLPTPDGNTLFALYFRAGQTITQGGSASGVQFCAYHGTVAQSGSIPEFYYSVLPDFTTGGMTSGCGAGTRYQNETSVSSHEMIESTTDAEVGLASVVGPPLAWYDPTNGEIGDICNAQQAAIVGGDGHTYTVQKEWSNQQNNCVVSGPATTNDFSISASPTSGSVTAGGSTTSTISTAVTAGSAGTVSLSVSGAPSGATASVSPTSVTAGSSSTLTVTTSSTTPAGTYTITVAGAEGSKSHSTTFSLGVNAAASNDFSISLSPTSASVAAGASATSNVSTAVTSGTAGTVSLSASGLPSGATASFNPTSMTAGSGSTLTVGTSATTPAGSYNISVTGTEGSATHSATFALTVTSSGGGGGGGITNGGFETGNLSGWSSTGTTAVVNSGAQSGTYAARVGSTTASRDSSISQTFTVPSGGTQLSFYYNVVCPDTVRYDWATATLKDNTTGVTTTVLSKTCVRPSSGWRSVTASVTAGHSYTLTLANHDDDRPNNPTYTLYDSIDITSSASSHEPPTRRS
jgi:hypothetical protein